MTKPGLLRSRRQTYLILLVLFTAVVLGGWHFAGAPLHAKLTLLRGQHGTLAEEQTLLDAKLQTKDAITQEWAGWQFDKERLDTVIPSLDELPRALGSLETLIARFPVTVNSLQVGETVALERGSTVALNFSVSGSDDSTIALLESLETFPQLLIIDSITWSAADPANSTLSIRFRLVLLDPARLAEPLYEHD
ncbi:MAG TPA: hypothetical protein VLH18_03030 [Candidatus Limnocylindrales bacterium]|nr:hypothetical protein [Candidatus Limnocylindrales bacterium]